VKIHYGLLAACAAIAQPALAQEVTISCSNVSDMKVYNPHGSGGIIGGPTNKTRTVRTDGRNAWVIDPSLGALPLREVQVNSSGLSFCGSDAPIPCDVTETLQKSDGTYHRQVTRTVISTSGEYRWGMSVFNASASMKTGVTIDETGTCDAAGIAGLRSLAGGGGGTPDSSNASTNEPARAGGSSNTGAESPSRPDDRADDNNPSTADNANAEQDALVRQEREAAEAAEAARLRAEAAKLAREKADAERARKDDEARVAKEQADAERARKQAEELAAREKAKADAKQRADQERRHDERALTGSFNGQATTCPGGGAGILYLRSSKPPRLGCNVQFQARCAGTAGSVVNFAQNNYIGSSCLGIGDATRIGQMPCAPEQVRIDMTSASCG
jgi:hypothetical protein